MPPNDSALFPLRFTGVHGAAGLDQQRDRFFEVPIKQFRETDTLLSRRDDSTTKFQTYLSAYFGL
jgi:hypothetical protein